MKSGEWVSVSSVFYPRARSSDNPRRARIRSIPTFWSLVVRGVNPGCKRRCSHACSNVRARARSVELHGRGCGWSHVIKIWLVRETRGSFLPVPPLHAWAGTQLRAILSRSTRASLPAAASAVRTPALYPPLRRTTLLNHSCLRTWREGVGGGCELLPRSLPDDAFLWLVLG